MAYEVKRKRYRPRLLSFSIATQRVLMLLAVGALLGMVRSGKDQLKIVKGAAHMWDEIERRSLRRAIDRLYRSKLIYFKYNEKDKSNTIKITREGKKVALTYQSEKMSIKPMKKWDGKWRMVAFDIPEKARYARDGIRRMLKRMGFFEYQKSVFVHPFDCRDEVDFIIEFYEIRPWVRFIIAESLDNEMHLALHFNLKYKPIDA